MNAQRLITEWVNFEYDPNYVDFSRNNTVPKEVVSVMEQLGI